MARQDPVHSWKAGPGEVMTVENKQTNKQMANYSKSQIMNFELVRKKPDFWLIMITIQIQIRLHKTSIPIVTALEMLFLSESNL